MPAKFKPYTRQSIVNARQWEWMSPDLQEAVQVVSHVLPFRTNEYVMDQLIDWNNIPDDPIYRLTFPHRDMLPAAEYAQLRDLVLYKKDAGRDRAAGARDPDAHEPAPGRPDDPQRAARERRPAQGPAAQVQGDRAVLPQRRPDLPRLLHLLLPLAAVRRHGRHEVRRARDAASWWPT